MQNVKIFLSNVPHHPGVYQMLGEKGEVLYVGKAKDLKKRLSSYFNKTQKDSKTLMLVKNISNIDITVTRSETEALLLECNLIKKHKPRYNILFRDDKSYPYIRISQNHTFPQIDFYRGALKKDGLYFGPYPNSTAVRETIHLIQKIFRVRTCQDFFYANRNRPCLHHQIGLCSGPCGNQVTADDYQQNVQHAILFLQGKNEEILEELSKKMEQAAANLNFEEAAKYRDQITQIRHIQERQYVSSAQGDVDVVGFASQSGIICIQLIVIRGGRVLGSRSYFPSVPAHSPEEEILTAFIAQHYINTAHEVPREIILQPNLAEKALLEETLAEASKHKVLLTHAVRGERKKWLEMALANAKQSLSSHLLNKANLAERFKNMQEVLQLNSLPVRIECFDISHTMGEATVASCVVFDQQGPVKNDYRRFNITDITPGDDAAAMRQALTRRYKRLQAEEQKLPDVLLIDGGLPQLNAAQEVLSGLNITASLLVGVAKGVTRKPGLETLHIPNRTAIHLPPDTLALHLIQQIRDEAHRFAITGHRARRDKKRRVSTLEAIAGIGAKRRQQLLRYFGGIQALNRASLDELTKVPGINQSLAERIYDALHQA